MSIKKNLIPFVLFLFIPSLFAQEKISFLEISGLKRTKITTIMNIIKVDRGDYITNDLTELVEQRLRKTGLFLDDMVVELIPAPEGQILRIHVEDRWTLIGMPFFAINQEKWTGGFFAVDSNLLGTQKILVTTVMLDQAGGSNGFFLYRDPAFLQSDFQFVSLLRGGNSQKSFTSLSGRETWEEYRSLGLSGSLGGGYQFSDTINLSGNLAISLWNDTPGETVPSRSGETRIRLILSPRIQYDDRYVHSLFSSGLTGSLSGEAAWEPAGNFSFTQRGSLSLGFVPVETLLLRFSLNGGLADSLPDSLMVLGGTVGSLTLPVRSIGTSRYLNTEVLLEYRLIDFGFASLTVPLYYEGGVLLDYYRELQLYQGFGSGFRLYLSKVAAPALGMDYRHNITTGTAGFSAFIGMQF